MFTRKMSFTLLAVLVLSSLALAPVEPLSPSAPAAPALTLFSDDFESGTGNWNLDANWSLVSDGGSQVLNGSGHAWATLKTGNNWTDYTFSSRFKIISGAVHFNFRFSENRGRYILGVHPGGMYLLRESPWGNFSSDLATNGTGFTPNQWYTIHIHTQGRRIYVTVDNDTLPRIDFTDSVGNTLWEGTIGLEVVGAGTPQARFDDVLINGVPAPDTTWIKTGGPIGGLGYDVRFASDDERVMYVTDNYSGVNKSSDGGLTWFTTNRGIIGRSGSSLDAVPVFSLTVDPNDYNVVYAGLKDVKGLYKTTNAANLWENITPNIPEAQFVFRGISIQAGNSNIVYAAGELPTQFDGKAFNKVKGRVYRSDDGGTNWTAIRDENNLFRYILINPSNPDVIYLSLGIFDREAFDSNCLNDPPVMGTGGVLKGVKTPSGWDWTRFDETHGLTDPYVGSLVMHPTNPDILLAGAGNVACSPRTVDGKVTYTGGVFLSEDGGQTWVKTLGNEIITSVEFSPSNPNLAYAGGQHRFFFSEDGGHSWIITDGQGFDWGPPGVIAGFPIDILVDPEDHRTLFVNNYGGGNVKSTDGGFHWSLASKGYTGALMFDVGLNPKNPRYLYGAARSGTFRSADGGSSWSGLAYEPAALAESYSVAVNPENPQIIITAQDKLGGVFRSTNRGTTWKKVFQVPGTIPGQALYQHSFKRIVFAPSNPDVVYGGTCRDPVRLDKGYTDSKGVFRSFNGGETWEEANDLNIEKECINDLAVHPQYPGLLYAATAANGVFKSTNGGESWQRLSGLAPTDIRSIAIKPDAPGSIYVGTQGNGVYRYFEGSSSWQQLVPGMEPNDAIWSLVFDPAEPDVVWAGSNRTGVYRWNPNLNLWVHVNDGLRMRAVTDLDISQDGKVLYAATWGEGIFRMGEVPETPSNATYLPLVRR